MNLDDWIAIAVVGIVGFAAVAYFSMLILIVVLYR